MEVTKVFYPETIEPSFGENSFYQPVSYTDGYEARGVFSPASKAQAVYNVPLPIVEVVNKSLDTQSRRILGNFTFAPTGALQIGNYESGTTGDVRISANGITARNIDGNTTFSLDSQTGDATFRGTVTAGSVITGTVNVGDSRVQIDGGNSRILITDENGTPRVLIGYQSGGF